MTQATSRIDSTGHLRLRDTRETPGAGDHVIAQSPSCRCIASTPKRRLPGTLTESLVRYRLYHILKALPILLLTVAIINF